MTFVTGTHEIGLSERRAGQGGAKPITIGNGTWVGTRAVILGGVTIGAGSVVGAGSIVRDSLPADTLSAGVPARAVRYLP